MISAEVKSPPTDPQELDAWLTLVVKRIGMQIAKSPDLVKNPQSYFCDKNGNRGMTGTVILETSNCTVHTWDEDSPAKFELDLYSCAEFSEDEVLDLVDIFGIIRYNSITIDRGHGLKLLKQYLPPFETKDITDERRSNQTQAGTPGNSTTAREFGGRVVAVA